MKSIPLRLSQCPAFLSRNLFAGILLATALAARAQTTPAATSNEEADKAWKETYKATQSPMPPKEWADHAPNDQEIKDFYVPALVKGADKARDFYTKYPDHAKAEAARKAEYNMITLAVEKFGDTDLNTRLDVLAGERAKDPKISDDEKFELRMRSVKNLMSKMPATLEAVAAQAEAMRKEFPKRPEVYQLMMIVMQESEGDRVKTLAKEIMDSPAPDQIKEQVAGTLKRMEALGKPLDIKYTAFDGREVDLAKLKGKVVMIDFWATWCGPCVAELPNVKAAYEKLHSQGFEIVGISFDEDKDALTKFIAKEKTPWPQFFDGKQWKNKFGVEFGINSIPTMWLVDKQGNLADLNARGALEEKVAKLLAQ